MEMVLEILTNNKYIYLCSRSLIIRSQINSNLNVNQLKNSRNKNLMSLRLYNKDACTQIGVKKKNLMVYLYVSL